MYNSDWVAKESRRTLTRLLPRIKSIINNPADLHIFLTRLETHFPRVFDLL